MIEHIKREPGRDWRVEVMCEQAELSRSQLTRWFNRLTGRSPNRHVMSNYWKNSLLKLQGLFCYTSEP